MNKRWGALVVSTTVFCIQGSAMAGSVAGTGGATEITQIQNNLQLTLSYAKQVEGYVRQGLQLQAELQNLIKNPMSLLGPEVGSMINTMGKIWNAGNSIGYNVAQIDRNFATKFKNTKAMDLSTAFTSWHSTNTDTLQSLLRAVGTQRENYASDQAAVADLYTRSQNTSGNLDTLQTISQINVRQIQELQALRDLLGSQAQASATYLATQNAKDQKNLEQMEAVLQPYKPDIPSAKSAAAPKWKGFGH